MYKFKDKVDPEFEPPVLIRFENGILKPNQEHAFTCRLYEGINKEKILAIATEHMVYYGRIEEDDLYENLLLLHKKNSKKVSMFITNTCTLRPFMPKKRRTDECDNGEEVSKENSLYELNKQFGSKRAKVAIKQREQMTLNIENAKDQLQEAVANIEVNDDELIASNKENFEFRPPINRKASQIKDVYILENLISTDVLNSLTEVSKNILDNEVNKPETCAFITERIADLKQLRPDDALIKCKIFLYTDCLIHCLKCSIKDLIKRDFKACPYSEIVNEDVLSKYTSKVNNKRARSRSMRDKTIWYIVVLCILACNYKLDLESLGKEIRMSVKALQEVARYLGLTSVGKSNCALKLPIPSGAPSFKGKRSR